MCTYWRTDHPPNPSIRKENEIMVGSFKDEALFIGDRIRNARRRKGFSVEYISGMLDMSAGNYRRVENGRQLITTKKLYELAMILEVSTDYILYGEAEAGCIAKVRSLFKGKDIDEIRTALAIIEVYLETCPKTKKESGTKLGAWSV